MPENESSYIEVDFTFYPRSPAAQKKFNAVKTGEIVWLVGGFDFYEGGAYKSSFGRRCVVKEFNREGIVLLDFKSNERAQTNALITKASILKVLNTLENEETQARFLQQFDIKEGDLENVSTAPVGEKSLAQLTKAELLAKIEALTLENESLKKKYIGPFTLD